MKAQKIYLGHLLVFLQDDLHVQKQDKESKADFMVLANHIKYLKEVNKILPYHNFDAKESVEMDKKEIIETQSSTTRRNPISDSRGYFCLTNGFQKQSYSDGSVGRYKKIDSAFWLLFE